jgi:hypothetical protein
MRPIFNFDSAGQARERLGDAIAALEDRLAKVAGMLADSEKDILAFYSFPAAHWSKLRSTNPLERFNKEIGRRTDVVGIFPDDRSLIRLVGMLCLEQNDEWLVGRRYLSAATPPPTARRHRSSPQPEQQNVLPRSPLPPWSPVLCCPSVARRPRGARSWHPNGLRPERLRRRHGL